MRTLIVKSPASHRTYETIGAAITRAREHPLQADASRSSHCLTGARIDGGSWTMTDATIRFSNGRELLVQSSEAGIQWQVHEARSGDAGQLYEPVQLVWKDSRAIFDPDAIVTRIVGATFERLFVNDAGLLLYTEGRPILWFHALRTSDSEGFLYGHLDE